MKGDTAVWNGFVVWHGLAAEQSWAGPSARTQNINDTRPHSRPQLCTQETRDWQRVPSSDTSSDTREGSWWAGWRSSLVSNDDDIKVWCREGGAGEWQSESRPATLQQCHINDFRKQFHVQTEICHLSLVQRCRRVKLYSSVSPWVHLFSWFFS